MTLEYYVDDWLIEHSPVGWSSQSQSVRLRLGLHKHVALLRLPKSETCLSSQSECICLINIEGMRVRKTTGSFVRVAELD